jgi:hypothetical protein
MAVKARFWVRSFEKSVSGQGGAVAAKVNLAPVTRSTDDNITWAKYTPSGTVEMYVTQEGAQDWFEERLGKDIAITFDDVEE